MKFVSLVQTGRTFLRFHRSQSVFCSYQSRIVYLSSPIQGLDILNPFSKLRSWTEFLCIPLYLFLFVGTLYGISHYRLFESYSKYLYRQEPAFHLAIFSLLLKVVYDSNLQIAWYATLLLFHYTAQCRESFSIQKCVIFVTYKYTCLFWLYSFIVCLNRQLHAVFCLWKNMRKRDHV
jgi:hypothetical protein